MRYTMIVLAGALLASCNYDNEEDRFDIQPSEEVISLTNHVEPIIKSSCATSGCHIAGAQSPDLSVKSNIISFKDEIKSQVSARTMPIGGSLSDEEIATIIGWVNAGGLDN